jgi:peroxiredoxin
MVIPVPTAVAPLARRSIHGLRLALPRTGAALGAWLCGLLLIVGGAARGRGLDLIEPPFEAPGFSLQDLNGRTHALGDYRGRYLLVNFWAVWCEPCREEMPALERTYRALRGEGFAMLAIHLGEEAEQARALADQFGLTFPLAMDPEMGLRPWRIRGVPTTYLLDPLGRVVAGATGPRVWDAPQMLGTLRALMAQPPAP